MSFAIAKIVTLLFATLGNLALICLLGCLVLARRCGRSDKKMGLKALTILILSLTFLALFPVDNWLAMPLENRASAPFPAKIDGIILLSGDERASLTLQRHEPALGSVAARYIKMASLARTYPDAKLAFVGGTGFLGEKAAAKNGEIAQNILQSLGIDPQRLTVESLSRTTFENALNSKQVLKPEEGSNWILITSALHMPRALASFRHQGWNVVPAPVDYTTPPQASFAPNLDFAGHLQGVNAALHEYIGFLVYRMQGKVDQLWF